MNLKDGSIHPNCCNINTLFTDKKPDCISPTLPKHVMRVLWEHTAEQKQLKQESNCAKLAGNITIPSNWRGSHKISSIWIFNMPGWDVFPPMSRLFSCNKRGMWGISVMILTFSNLLPLSDQRQWTPINIKQLLHCCWRDLDIWPPKNNNNCTIKRAFWKTNL